MLQARKRSRTARGATHRSASAVVAVAGAAEGRALARPPALRAKAEEAIRRLGDIKVRCCERVQYALTLLPNLSDAAVADAALKTCEEINRLESDADRVMRSAMSKPFRDEPDVRELIKLKAIYERLETIPDRCEDVANLIEGVALKNA